MVNEATVIGTNAARRTRSDQYREIYANLCQGRIGAYDLNLSFFITKESPAGDGLVNEEQVTVTMSPIQFKLLTALCNGLTAAYEQTFAPIVVPPGAANPNMAPDRIIGVIKAAQAAQVLREATAKPKAITASDSSSGPKPLAKRPRAKKKAH